MRSARASIPSSAPFNGSLGPDDRAAAVRHRRRLFLPVLGPWGHRPRHSDAVYPDLVHLLIEEAEIALDFGAFRDRVGVGPDDISENLFPELDRIVAGLALVRAAGSRLARDEKLHA